MKRAIALLTVAMASVMLFAGAAFSADLSAEPAEFGGHAYVDGSTGNMTWNDPQRAAGTDIYSNVTSGANFGFSSTSIPSIWGDRLTTVGQGTLSEMDFTVFNTGASLGPLLTASVAINIYDSNTALLIGGFTTNVNWGGGLAPGFYSIVTVTNLDPFLINLNVNDVIVTQQITAMTGTANRLGIASLDPVTLGLSANTMYISSATVGGGVPGFYNIGNPPLNANPGYRLNALQAVKTEASTWGKVKALYR